VSFAREHPDWRTFLYTDCDPGPVPGVEVRSIEKPGVISQETWDAAHAPERSDLWRYHWLATEGGLYSDTDMIYYDSVEPMLKELDEKGCESGITQDSGYRPFNKGGLSLSIGVLSSHPGSVFYKRILEKLVERSGSFENDKQSFGVVPILGMWPELTSGILVGNIPGRFFYGKFSASGTRNAVQAALSSVWRPGVDLSPGAVALHWFGSSSYSVAAEADSISESNVDLYSETPVGKALAKRRRP
jgi:hypothetical protein